MVFLLLFLSTALVQNPAAAAVTGPSLRGAVVVPGFLSDAQDFKPLARALTARGLPTAVAPVSLWDWVPVLGGRSVRPVLERVDHAVRHIAAGSTELPPIEYGLADLAVDFLRNPGGVAQVGGSFEPDAYPVVEPQGIFPPPARTSGGRIALIGHSAGGYIARIYLSNRAYGGKAYCGSRLVHSLVTLGTPHSVGLGVAFANVAWARREPTPPGVACLAVGSRGTPGDSSGSLTRGAYSFCTAAGQGGELLDGDGITTAESSIDLDGAEVLMLDGVLHYPFTAPGPLADLFAPELAQAYREGKPWYGSEGVLDSWAPWLLARCDEAVP